MRGGLFSPRSAAAAAAAAAASRCLQVSAEVGVFSKLPRTPIMSDSRLSPVQRQQTDEGKPPLCEVDSLLTPRRPSFPLDNGRV